MLAESAPRLVRQIHEQNLPHFARLFTAVVLQAAAAGEALLDRELTELAQRNPARFSRLNQRMQVRSLHAHWRMLLPWRGPRHLGVLGQTHTSRSVCWAYSGRYFCG